MIRLSRSTHFASYSTASGCRRRAHVRDGKAAATVTVFPGPKIHLDKRYLCSELVAVELGDVLMGGREVLGVFEEITRTGACLQLEEPAKAGSPLRISGLGESRGCDFRGEVVRCQRVQGLGYFVEVRFGPGCRWSPEQFMPQHLFDPDELHRPSQVAGVVGI